MDRWDRSDGFDKMVPFVQPLQVSVADHIALTASYDQCLTQAMALHAQADLEVRTAMLTLSLPRLAVMSLTTLGGLVSYLTHPETAVKAEVREMVLAASFAGRYPEYGR